MKVISGGQTGADQGGLEGARDAGVETGGTAPYDWGTEDGVREKLLTGFGLVSGPWDAHRYPKRTRMNVLQSNATVFFGDMESPGSRLTYRYCESAGRWVSINPTAEDLASFIVRHDVRVLNVAGNRESKNPGIQERVRGIVRNALNLCQNWEE